MCLGPLPLLSSSSSFTTKASLPTIMVVTKAYRKEGNDIISPYPWPKQVAGDLRWQAGGGIEGSVTFTERALDRVLFYLDSILILVGIRRHGMSLIHLSPMER